jgi:hypothetical protein
LFEVAPAAGGGGVAGVRGSLVVAERASSELGELPKDAHV